MKEHTVPAAPMKQIERAADAAGLSYRQMMENAGCRAVSYTHLDVYKRQTEQYVLGEMLDILIEQDTDLNVELTQGVGGGTSNIQPAMESGEFDLYPEYTGTAWNMVLGEAGLYTEALFDLSLIHI